jgi:excinuclease ABC subunit C
VNGIDDYGMMAEIMKRRLSKGDLPDLFVIDGGRGHLSTVLKILENKADRTFPDVVSIAKPDEAQGEKHDKIYLPGRKNPVRLHAGHPVLLLMERIRDEAHRRAITYHRKLRGKRLRESELDRIPGIGPKRKRILLHHFKSIKAIAAAQLTDLKQVPGLGGPPAENVFQYFRSSDPSKEKKTSES